MQLLFLPLYQRTPLHVAAKEGRDYTVEILVKKGAITTIRDKDGVSLHYRWSRLALLIQV